MFKKMIPVLIIVLISITLIISAAVILWTYLDRSPASADPNKQAVNSVQSVKPQDKTAKQISDLTVKMDDITTNLSNNQFIKIGFAFELENKKTTEEFSLLDFKVKSIIIETLSDLTPEQIKGSKGIDFLSTSLMNKINLILQEGKVTHINITNFVLS